MRDVREELEETLNAAYEVLEGDETAEAYHRRHGINSLGILTVTDDERAALIADFLADRVRGKTVVEIGGGIGLLALHLSQHANKVYVIEADPMWTSVYVMMFFARKPKNVTWIFGAADEMAGQLKADVALFCTHSDSEGMAAAGRLFAPEVIDVYADVLQGTEETSPLWPLLQARKLCR